MDQHSNNYLNDFLKTLVANPADETGTNTYNLQQLVNYHPQSGVLHALLTSQSEDRNLQRASLYFNPLSLYKLINTPAALRGIAFEKIYIGEGIFDEHQANNEIVFAGQVDEQTTEQIADLRENYFSEFSIVGDGQESTLADADGVKDNFTKTYADETEGDEAAVEAMVEDTLAGTSVTEMPVWEIETDARPGEYPLETEIITGEPENTASADNFIEDAPAETQVVELSETEMENAPGIEEYPAQAGSTQITIDGPDNAALDDDQIEDTLAETDITDMPEAEKEAVNELTAEDDAGKPQVYETAEQHFGAVYNEGEPIEDEIFEEIGEIELPGAKATETAPANQNLAEAHKAEVNESASETEKLILNNIAGADFFMFEKAFGAPTGRTGEQPTADQELTADVHKTLPAFTTDSDTEQVSKYHDDKMPYTFMWWLDKTRKEHMGIYQPYAQPPAIAHNTTTKLEQQYYENIFHLTSTEDLEKSTATNTIQFDMKPELIKEHQIIERFLKEEPQIKPQSSDKLDNENKAKKSAEDKDGEIITETLAIIYTDQMLYHKAIATYKKLMLKFPEKSATFAGKIEQLEKKTN